MEKVLVTGAGGFIGHHLVTRLVAEGFWVRAVDLKEPEYETSCAHEFERMDLRRFDDCLLASRGVEQIYHLAADTGGINYLGQNLSTVARNDSLINLHLLEAARHNRIARFLYTSSVGVYPHTSQAETQPEPLQESRAWPAEPEDGQGLEQLFMERMCRYYQQDHGLQTRVARLHGVYGPKAVYHGGKEHVVAALCRQIAVAQADGLVEVWGDGQQTRSFLYIDDCIEGIFRVMHSEFTEPLNLGSDVSVTINDLVDLIGSVADKDVRKTHDASMPQGARHRSSDNTEIRHVLGWTPQLSLDEGLIPTYRWIASRLETSGRVPASSTVQQALAVGL